MALKILLLAALPIIILWVVGLAIFRSMIPCHSRNAADAGCFDPIEGLHGII